MEFYFSITIHYLSAMKFVFLLIAALVFFSCTDMKKGKQMEQITALQAELDSLEKEWNNQESNTIDSLSVICTATIDSISLLYNDQKIAVNLASKIDQFKQANTDLKELKRVHSFFPSLLNDKKQALASLKTDVNKGSGRREKYDEYIDFETKELATIRQQYQEYLQAKEQCIEYYASSSDAVADFLTGLKNARENQEEIAR